MDPTQEAAYEALREEGLSDQEARAVIAEHVPSLPVSTESLSHDPVSLNDSLTHMTQGEDPLLHGLSLGEMEWRVANSPPMRWTVPGLVPDGLTLLAGPPKMGKSFMCLDIAVGVASGGATLGDSLVCNQGDVLYCAGEDMAPRIIQRMSMLLGDPDLYPREHLMIADQRILMERPVGAIAQRWVETRERPRLLIIDTKARLLDKPQPKQQRGNAYNLDYDSMTAIHNFTASRGISLLVVTHTNQMRLEEGEDWFNKIQGTSGIVGVADGAVLLDAKRGEREGSLRVTGRDVEDSEMTVYRSGPWWHVTDRAPRGRQGDQTVIIRDWVCEQELPVGPVEVAAALGIPERTVRTYMTRLVSRGELERSGRGKYTKPTV